jgi:hypothetical protein
VSAIHSEWDLDFPTSMVFPKHQINHYDTLERYGINIVRRPIENYERRSRNKFEKFNWFLTRSHPTTGLGDEDGITETYCTPHPSLTAAYLPNGQIPPHPAFRVIPLKIRQRIQRKYIQSGIDRAAERNENIHLWTHLHNLSNQYQWRPVSAGLEYIAKRRNEGSVELFKMDDLVNGSTA